MPPGPTTQAASPPPAQHQALSKCIDRKMPGKAIMHSTFPPIWLAQVVGGIVPNYKAGLEPPGEFPALPLAWVDLSKHGVAPSINLSSPSFQRETFK